MSECGSGGGSSGGNGGGECGSAGGSGQSDAGATSSTSETVTAPAESTEGKGAPDVDPTPSESTRVSVEDSVQESTQDQQNTENQSFHDAALLARGHDQANEPRDGTDTSDPEQKVTENEKFNRAASEYHRDSPLSSDAAADGNPPVEYLSAVDRSQDELKGIATREFPERLHPLIDKSEILSVSTAEHQNEMYKQKTLDSGKSPDSLGPDAGWQRPAKETGKMNVVEMRLTEPLACGIAHRVDAAGNPYYGRYFSESAEAHLTPNEVRENHALPTASTDKTHVSWGALAPGSVIVLSEQSDRTTTLPEWKNETVPVTQSPDADVPANTPPLAEKLPARTFQFELKEGNPAEQFTPETHVAPDGSNQRAQWQLKPDVFQ